MAVVSVVVPIYNTMQWLADCVESIRGQTLQDIEIILIDDGSTDYSGVLCDSYEEIDDRIRVLHQENKGVSAARNAGIDVATGKYIMFCDSDDYVASDWCSCAVELAEEYPDALVSLTFAEEGLDGIQFSLYETEKFTFFKHGEYLKFFQSRRSIHTSNKIFKKSVIRQYKIRFDDKMLNVEDSCFVASYLETRRYIVLRNISPLCFHRHWSSETLSNKFLGARCYDAYRKEVEAWKPHITHNEMQEFLKYFFWSRGVPSLVRIIDPRNPDSLEKQKQDCQNIVKSKEFKEWCQAAITIDTDEPMLRAMLDGDFYEVYTPLKKWMEERRKLCS